MIEEKTEVTNFETARRDLMALRVAHGADTAIGHHASNIVELIQMPNPPALQLKRQMDGLQRALAAGE